MEFILIKKDSPNKYNLPWLPLNLNIMKVNLTQARIRWTMRVVTDLKYNKMMKKMLTLICRQI